MQVTLFPLLNVSVHGHPSSRCQVSSLLPAPGARPALVPMCPRGWEVPLQRRKGSVPEAHGLLSRAPPGPIATLAGPVLQPRRHLPGARTLTACCPPPWAYLALVFHTSWKERRDTPRKSVGLARAEPARTFEIPTLSPPPGSKALVSLLFVSWRAGTKSMALGVDQAGQDLSHASQSFGSSCVKQGRLITTPEGILTMN